METVMLQEFPDQEAIAPIGVARRPACFGMFFPVRKALIIPAEKLERDLHAFPWFCRNPKRPRVIAVPKTGTSGRNQERIGVRQASAGHVRKHSGNAFKKIRKVLLGNQERVRKGSGKRRRKAGRITEQAQEKAKRNSHRSIEIATSRKGESFPCSELRRSLIKNVSSCQEVTHHPSRETKREPPCSIIVSQGSPRPISYRCS